MNEYINYYDNLSEEELMHYGVVGMKWGIRRARKVLSSADTNYAERKRALDSLEKHKDKASAKVAKLESKRPKLEDSVNRKVSKYSNKASDLESKAARQERKAYSILATQESKEKRLLKAGKLKAKADTINADIAKAKARLAENDAKTNLFKKGINDIDELLVSSGRGLAEGVITKSNGKADYIKTKDGITFVNSDISADMRKKITSIESKYDKKLKTALDRDEIDDDEIDDIEFSRLREIDDLFNKR